jgi:hypothetical protein
MPFSKDLEAKLKKLCDKESITERDELVKEEAERMLQTIRQLGPRAKIVVESVDMMLKFVKALYAEGKSDEEIFAENVKLASAIVHTLSGGNTALAYLMLEEMAQRIGTFDQFAGEATLISNELNKII